MIRDSIVEELHQIRRTHAEEFKFDVNAICEEYRRQEKQSKLQVVSLPPKRRVEMFSCGVVGRIEQGDLQ